MFPHCVTDLWLTGAGAGLISPQLTVWTPFFCCEPNLLWNDTRCYLLIWEVREWSWAPTLLWILISPPPSLVTESWRLLLRTGPAWQETKPSNCLNSSSFPSIWFCVAQGVLCTHKFLRKKDSSTLKMSTDKRNKSVFYEIFILWKRETNLNIFMDCKN